MIFYEKGTKMVAMGITKRMTVACFLGSLATLVLIVASNMYSAIPLAIAAIFSASLTGLCIVLTIVSLLHVSRFAAATWWIGSTFLIVMANYMYPASSNDVVTLCNILYGSVLIVAVVARCVSRLTMKGRSTRTSVKPIPRVEPVVAQSSGVRGQNSDLATRMEEPLSNRAPTGSRQVAAFSMIDDHETFSRSGEFGELDGMDLARNFDLDSGNYGMGEGVM